MTTYTVESGIPVPQGGPSRSNAGRPKSPLRATLEQLQPGQSVLLDTAEEFRRASAVVTHSWERRFCCRKVAGQGWRVWRLA